MSRRTALSICRYCAGQCGVTLEIEEERIVSVRGDKQHPLSKGYACIKGLQGGYALSAPDRILRPLKRRADGGFDEIPLDAALDEIAVAMRAIADEDGPASLAVFKGTQAYMHAPLPEMMRGFLAAVGSPSLFSTMTIDQSAKYVAFERLGMWAGNLHHMDDSDVMMIVGGNPLVSIAVMGVTPLNVTKRLRDARQRGTKLIVVDPRRTETAAAADLHLQIVPGEDPTLFAAMLREILARGWEDRDFCRDHVAGLDVLRDAVAPFTLPLAEARTGVPGATIAAAARMFARDAQRGFATTGTGPSMAAHSNLSEHLIQCLNVVCGRFNRAGDVVRAGGLIRPRPLVAEVIPPQRNWERGPKGRVRGFGSLFGEMMSATLPEEILTPGKGRIRSLLVVGANPAMAMPDQRKTVEALRALELLVAVEPYMTATARLAHYILPPVLQYEREDFLYGPDFEAFNPEPYQQYAVPVVARPEGSDLIEDWRVFHALGARLGLTLSFCGEPLDMDNVPTTEGLMRRIVAGGPLSIDALKQNPRGMYVDVPPAVVQPGRVSDALRFAVAPDDVVAEIAAVLAERPVAERPVAERGGFSHMLISRRTREMLNTLGMNFPASRERMAYNPAYLHPDGLAELGLAEGDRIEIESDHGRIDAIVAADPTVRPGAVSMSHCWGGLPDDEADYADVGSCTSLLVSVDRDCETINAMPRMSAIPVNIRRKRDGHEKAPRPCDRGEGEEGRAGA